jgi:osmoprotectant transport system permease protein
MNWGWLDRNADVIWEYLAQHVRITAISLLLGILMAFPIGLAGYRWRRTYPPILAATQVLYTIPSIALFVLLINVVGLGEWPVIIGLAIYSLVVLVRNIVEGLRGVPPEVRDAATAMGYRQTRRLLTVELPLAVPAIVAGLRVAAVSTISLVSVGALIGAGGLGQLFIHGFQIDNPIEIVAGIVLTVVLAFVVDVLLVLGGRVVTPWERVAAARG